MKVNELIKELQKLDPNGIVHKSYSIDYNDSDGYGFSEDEEREIHLVESYETTIEQKTGPRGGIRKIKALKVIIS